MSKLNSRQRINLALDVLSGMKYREAAAIYSVSIEVVGATVRKIFEAADLKNSYTVAQKRAAVLRKFSPPPDKDTPEGFYPERGHR